MARQDKNLLAFITLLASSKGRKASAEAAVRYLKKNFKLDDCLIVLEQTAQTRPLSYGDKPHYLSALILPAPGRGLILPDQMKSQGWFRLELHTHRRVGWLLIRIKRSRRKQTLKSSLQPHSELLAIALSAASSELDLNKAARTFDEQLDKTTAELTHTNKKLVAMDETKDEFITMASHQLRTPLTSVKGYVSMVLEGDAGEINELQKKLLTQAFISSQRMVYLIADLLNMSRLRTGRFVIEPSDTNLPNMVSEEIDQLRETAKAKGVKLKFKKPGSFPLLQLDENKIRQVVMNFIDNAIHYTPAGGTVTVELELKRSSVELRVKDTGMGVPRADQHKLFTKFFRASNAQRIRPDGTGLGLFMAKKVVVAQGGAIIFKSVEGKGSTFGFMFPRSIETDKNKT